MVHSLYTRSFCRTGHTFVMFHTDLSLSGPSSLWAETEIKRRKTIHLYMENTHSQGTLSGSDTNYYLEHQCILLVYFGVERETDKMAEKREREICWHILLLSGSVFWVMAAKTRRPLTKGWRWMGKNRKLLSCLVIIVLRFFYKNPHINVAKEWSMFICILSFIAH